MSRAEFTKATKKVMACGHCGNHVFKTYNLSAARLAKPIYCNLKCEKDAKRSRALEKRKTHFWTKVKRGEAGACWEWSGFKDSNGYGRYGRILAHRIAFQLSKSADIDGWVICHSCDNPSCVNPRHLWLGVQSDNVADMVAKGRRVQGRTRRGEDSNKAKIAAEEALHIFNSKASVKTLAKTYGISSTAVRLIKNGRNWSHVTGGKNASA